MAVSRKVHGRHLGKTWPVRKRNRCPTSSQSGLNLKYRSGGFPTECKASFLTRFLKKLIDQQDFEGDITLSLNSGLSLNRMPRFHGLLRRRIVEYSESASS